jgi:hypothetical protein
MVRIDSFKYGEVIVKGKTYYSDVVVFWNGKVKMRKKGHVFGIEEFVHILEKEPEAVVLGTGVANMVRVTPEVKQLANRKGVKLFVDMPGNAVDIFNGLIKDGKKAVAVIHTTG